MLSLRVSKLSFPVSKRLFVSKTQRLLLFVYSQFMRSLYQGSLNMDMKEVRNEEDSQELRLKVIRLRWPDKF